MLESRLKIVASGENRVWKYYPQGVHFYRYKGADLRMKPESEEDCQISDFGNNLDLHVTLFFVTNFSYFSGDWVLGEEMRLLISFVGGLKMFPGTKGGE